MKVALICNKAFGTDGISLFIVNNYCHFKRKGDNYHLIYPGISSSKNCVDKYLNEFKTRGDVAVCIPKQQGVLRFVFSFYKYLRSNSIDIAHVHGSSAGILLEIILSRLAGVKTVIAHSHNTRGNHIHIHKIIRPLVSWMTDEQFACGQLAGEWMYGRKCKFVIIPNGIDTIQYQFRQSIRDQVRQELGIGEEIVIGHIGAFNGVKNQSFLLYLLKELIENGFPHTRLMLVGDGSQKKDAENIAGRLGIADKVMFLGIRKDVPQLLMGMDVFCLPSLYEGFPTVAVETQASGLPILMSATISEETCITDLVKFLSIDIGTNVWKSEIQKFMDKRSERSEYAAKVKKVGYDIKESAMLIEKTYLKYKCIW